MSSPAKLSDSAGLAATLKSEGGRAQTAETPLHRSSRPVTLAPPAPVSGEFALEPPPEFDGYRILRRIGNGSMGQVYLGHDTLLDRQVALKFVDAMSSGDEARERFLVEARAIARLQHPNVLAIHRVGEVGGRLYLVTELVRGQSLADLHLPLPPRDVLRMGLGIARGLAAAHRRGVLHRDVKPANVTLSEEGEVKLLDFGLAKFLGERRRRRSRQSANTPAPMPEIAGRALGLTPSGSQLGTPLYMAPEIWEGESATYRSDVYSLGAVLFELATGEPPYRASTQGELREAVLTAAPPSARLGDSALAKVVQRCLERDPARRFASGDEVRHALEQLRPDERTFALPGGNPYRGLAAFGARHRALFFGRSAEIGALVERLRSEALVVVTGSSGVGKSSLCLAGIGPALADGALGQRWKVASIAPGRKPLSALAQALAERVGASEQSLAARMREDPAAVGRELRRPSPEPLLLVVDPLDDLCTLADREEAERFCEVLGWLAAPTEGLRLLAAARADHIGALAQLPGLGPELARALHVLQPLPPAGIRDAVVAPARAKGMVFESEALVDELVAAGATGAGGLPLLQFALAELWERRDTDRNVVPASALAELGGVGGALARHADGVLERMLPATRHAAARILPRLVTRTGARARCSAAELAARSSADRAALDALVEGRLLVAQEEDGETRYALAHESLLTSWPRLRHWLDADAGARAVRERLSQAASEWLRLGRSRELLWSQRRLAELRDLDEAQLPERESAFVAASRRAVRRAELLRALAVLLVLGAGGGLVAAVRAHTAAQMAQRVRVELGHASDALASATRGEEGEAALRRDALSGFDRGEGEAAERTWSDAAHEGRSVDEHYARASSALEAALALDPSSRPVRHQLAEVLFRRALRAERDHQPAVLEELLARLALYDEDGSLRARWSAPAQLHVATVAGAKLELRPYVNGRAHLELGEPRALGPEGATLAPGSYLLSARAPGRAEVRLPLLIARGERLELPLELPAVNQVPEGFAVVPAGTFLFGSSGDDGLRRDFFHTVPLHPVATPGFLIGRHEVTFADWLAYLEALPARERARRVPGLEREGFQGDVALRRDPHGRWALALKPGSERLSAVQGARIHYQGRARRADQDWLRWPVSGVSWDEAQGYLDWLDQTGRVKGARFCSELEWERAARGADGREYPSGSALAPDDANIDETYDKSPRALGPDEVGSHPGSSSPFGVDDLAGNVWELTRSALKPGEIVARGGSFGFGRSSCRSANREVVERSFKDVSLGFRVCADLGRAP